MLANFLHNYCSNFQPPLFICTIRLLILKSSNTLQIFGRLVETVDETVVENNCFTFYASFYKLLVHQLEFWHHFTKFWCISWSFDKTLLIHFKISLKIKTNMNQAVCLRIVERINLQNISGDSKRIGKTNKGK